MARVSERLGFWLELPFGEDSFVWKLDVNGFSTASSYKLISAFNEEFSPKDSLVLSGLADIWRSKAPSKINFFLLETIVE